MPKRFHLVSVDKCSSNEASRDKKTTSVRSNYVTSETLVYPRWSIGRERLVIKNVRKEYPVREGSVVVLDDFTMTFRGGEGIVVLAPPKSGKSALGLVLSGMEEKTDGKMYLSRMEWPHPSLFLRPRRTWPVQLVRQAPYRALVGGMTLRDIIREEYKALKGVELQRPLYSAELCVSLAGLQPGQLNASIWRFNRLAYIQAAIALKLLVNPRILILDEIFEALTSREICILHRSLLSLRERTGITIIFLTVNVEAAFGPVERVAILKEGRVESFDSKMDMDLWLPSYKALCTGARSCEAASRDGKTAALSIEAA